MVSHHSSTSPSAHDPDGSRLLRPAAEVLQEVLGLKKAPSAEQQWRWRRGLRLPSGEVVKLECKRCGGRWFTTVQAVQQFIQQQTAGYSD